MSNASQPPGTPVDFVAEETNQETHPLSITTPYRIANQIAGICVALPGLGLTFGGLSLGLDNKGIPGPGLFPLIIGSIMLALGIALFVLASTGRLDRSGDTEVPDRLGMRRILITILATCVFIWALLWTGYPITMTLYVFALLIFVGQRRWLSSAVVAVGFGFGSYLAFTGGLGLQLPGSAFPLLQTLGL